MFPKIDDAHGELEEAVEDLKKHGANPIAITVVSVNDTINGQMVVFDCTKWSKDKIVKRLRLAADFLEAAPTVSTPS